MPSVACSLGSSDFSDESLTTWEKKMLMQQKQQQQQQMKDKNLLKNVNNVNQEQEQVQENRLQNLPNLPTFNMATSCSDRNNQFQDQIARNQFQLPINPLGPTPYYVPISPYYNVFMDPYYNPHMYYQRDPRQRFDYSLAPMGLGSVGWSYPQQLQQQQYLPSYGQSYPGPYPPYPPQFTETPRPYNTYNEHPFNYLENFNSEIFKQIMPTNRIDEMLHIILIILIFLFVIQLVELILR